MRLWVWGLVACPLLGGVGLAWWLGQEPRCGPGEAGKLWFSMAGARTTISAYCDSEGRYVRPPVPLVVPSPDKTVREPVEAARLVISELDDAACPPGVVRERPQTEGFLVYCDAETGEVVNEPLRSQLRALSCGPPAFVKVITAENAVLCRSLVPKE